MSWSRLNKFRCEHDFQPVEVPDDRGKTQTILQCSKCLLKRSILEDVQKLYVNHTVGVSRKG